MRARRRRLDALMAKNKRGTLTASREGTRDTRETVERLSLENARLLGGTPARGVASGAARHTALTRSKRKRRRKMRERVESAPVIGVNTAGRRRASAHTLFTSTTSHRARKAERMRLRTARSLFPVQQCQARSCDRLDPRPARTFALSSALQKWEDHFASPGVLPASEAGRLRDARRWRGLKMNERLQVKARPLWVRRSLAVM